MYIAKNYFETNMKKIFKKGDEVPAEIAEKYPTRVEEVITEVVVAEPVKVEKKSKKKVKEELLIDDSSVVELVEEIVEDGEIDSEEKGILGKLFGKK